MFIIQRSWRNKERLYIASIFCCLIRKRNNDWLLSFSQLLCWFLQKGCLNLTNCYASFHDYKSIWIDILSMLTLVDTNTPVCLYFSFRASYNSSLCWEFPDGAQSFVYCSRNNCDGFNKPIVNGVGRLWRPPDSFAMCFCGPEGTQRSIAFLAMWSYWPILTLH